MTHHWPLISMNSYVLSLSSLVHFWLNWDFLNMEYFSIITTHLKSEDAPHLNFIVFVHVTLDTRDKTSRWGRGGGDPGTKTPPNKWAKKGPCSLKLWWMIDAAVVPFMAQDIWERYMQIQTVSLFPLSPPSLSSTMAIWQY